MIDWTTDFVVSRATSAPQRWTVCRRVQKNDAQGSRGIDRVVLRIGVLHVTAMNCRPPHEDVYCDDRNQCASLIILGLQVDVRRLCGGSSQSFPCIRIQEFNERGHLRTPLNHWFLEDCRQVEKILLRMARDINVSLR